MKLSTVLAKRALDQLEEQTSFRDTQIVPDSSPAIPQLNRIFGEHTFFLDRQGLHIVEPVPAAERPPTSARIAKVVKLASWQDAAQTSLSPHKPQPTDVVVVLGEEEGSGEAPKGAA